MSKSQPILLAGIPRSGSTWAGKVLASADGWHYSHEPDNEKLHPLADILKRGLHRYPYLPASEVHKDYEELWKQVFSGIPVPTPASIIHKKDAMPHPKTVEYQIIKKCGLPDESHPFRDNPKSARVAEGDLMKSELLIDSGRHAFDRGSALSPVVVKSVHVILSLPWIETHFDPKIVIILRNPLNVIASYLRMDIKDSLRNVFGQGSLVRDHLAKHQEVIQSNDNRERRMAVQIGGIYKVIEEQAQTHPKWVVIRHEDLCADPIGEFRKVYHQLGLEWTPKVKETKEKSNRPGTGFVTNRLARDEIDKWKAELTHEQQRDIREIIRSFNLGTYRL